MELRSLARTYLAWQALTPWRLRLWTFLLLGVPVVVVWALQSEVPVTWLIGYLLLLVPGVISLRASRRYEASREPRPVPPDLRRPDGQSPTT